MKVHGLKSCDSTRAALKALRAAGLAAELVDLRAAPPLAEDIDRWLARLGPGLLNRASTTWRGLDAAARARPPAALLADYPTLFKRPVIESGRALTLGWSEAVLARHLEGRAQRT